MLGFYNDYKNYFYNHMVKARHAINITQKKFICDLKEENDNIKHATIVDRFRERYKFAPSLSSVSKILKKKDLYLDMKHSKIAKIRTSNVEQLEAELYNWFKELEGKPNIILNECMLKEQARSLAASLNIGNFSASNGWLVGFKRRHNIKLYKLSGEANKINLNDYIDDIELLKKIINTYHPFCIYNLDESGLFYQLLPDKSLMTGPANGSTKSKKRVTIVPIANAMGKFLKPIIIGHSKNPRCFNHWDYSPLLSYYSNSNAWMKSDIFRNYLLKWDSSLSHTILLLLDNFSGHDKTLQPDLKNIKMLFLPPNTTSRLQPLDLGIIQNIKLKYKLLLSQNYLFQYNTTKSIQEIDLKRSCLMLIESMNSVESSTIRNCFAKSPLFETWSYVIRPTEVDDKTLRFTNNILEEDLENLAQNINSLGISSPMSAINYLTVEEDHDECTPAENRNSLTESNINIEFEESLNNHQLKTSIMKLETEIKILNSENLITFADDLILEGVIGRLKEKYNRYRIAKTNKSIKDHITKIK